MAKTFNGGINNLADNLRGDISYQHNLGARL